MAISLSVDIREVDYNEATGKQMLTVIASVTTSGQTYNTTGTAGGTVKVDITGTVSDTESRTFTCSFGQNTTTQILSQSFTMDRGAEATARATVTLNTGVSAGTITKTATRTLMSSGNNIEIVGLSTSNNYMDQAYTVKLAYPQLAATADVYVQSFGTLPAGGRTIATGTTATDISWTPTTAQFAPYCTDSQSAICTVRVDFKTSGGVKISTFDATFRLVVPQSVRPTVSSVSISDSSGNYEDYGIITPDSVITVTASASTQYGATITLVQARLGSSSYGETITLAQSGSTWTGTFDSVPTAISSPQLTVTASDSRGRSGTYTQGMSTGSSSELYFNVGLTKALRYANGAEDTESTTVRVEAHYTSKYPGGGARTATLTTRYRRVGVTSWTTYSTLSVSGGSQAQIVTIRGLSTSYSWEVQLTLSAGGETATWSTTIATGSPILDFAAGGKAVQMWGVAQSDEDGFTVNRKATFKDDTVISGNMRRLVNGAERSFLTTNWDTGRPVITEHTALLAGQWLQGQMVSSGMPGFEGEDDDTTIYEQAINLIRLTEDGTVELNWTDGGIRGTAWKQLWTGTWSRGSTSYMYDLPRYNLIVFVLGGSLAGQRLPLWRHPRQANQATSWAGAGGVTYFGSGGIAGVLVASVAGNGDYRLNASDYPVRIYWLNPSSTSITSQGSPVSEIWGVL